MGAASTLPFPLWLDAERCCLTRRWRRFPRRFGSNRTLRNLQIRTAERPEDRTRPFLRFAVSPLPPVRSYARTFVRSFRIRALRAAPVFDIRQPQHTIPVEGWSRLGIGPHTNSRPPWPLTPIFLCAVASREGRMALGSAGVFRHISNIEIRICLPRQPFQFEIRNRSTELTTRSEIRNRLFHRFADSPFPRRMAHGESHFELRNSTFEIAGTVSPIPRFTDSPVPSEGKPRAPILGRGSAFLHQRSDGSGGSCHRSVGRSRSRCVCLVVSENARIPGMQRITNLKKLIWVRGFLRRARSRADQCFLSQDL